MPKVTTKRTQLRRCRSRTQSRFPIPLDSLDKLYPVSIHEEEKIESFRTRKVSFDGSSLYLVSKRKSSGGNCLRRTRPCLLSIVSSDSYTIDADSSTSKTSLSSSSSLSSTSLLPDVVNDSAHGDTDTFYEYGQFVDVVPPYDSSPDSIDIPYLPRTTRSSLNLAFSPYPLARVSRRHAITSRTSQRRCPYDRQFNNTDTARTTADGDLNIFPYIHQFELPIYKSSDTPISEIKSCEDALDHLRIQ